MIRWLLDDDPTEFNKLCTLFAVCSLGLLVAVWMWTLRG